MVNDGLVLIGKFNTNLRSGMKFDEAIFEAGRSRFRAIFLTSVTTIAGLAPLLLEKSRQAQFLKPMAISIAYGIGFATVLTLLMLPLLLSFGNNVKVAAKRLWTGDKVTPEEVERAIREQHEEDEMSADTDSRLNVTEGTNATQNGEETSKVIEEETT